MPEERAEAEAEAEVGRDAEGRREGDGRAAPDAGAAAKREPGDAGTLAAAEARAQAAEARLAEREKELVEKLARLQADFDNYRRRTREDLAQASARGRTEFLTALLPVLDNLDRALAHAKDEGLQLIARHLQATLSSQGLLVLEPMGEAFDAKVHEALGTEAREGVKSGTVITVVEKGYALEGRVLRPARVIVAA